MQSAVIIAAIALAVFLGYKTKINTGFFCIVFAYFIGCFWLDLKPKALIAFWPTNTMFVIISVSLFYNVAAANGTLEKISRSLLYACRKFPGMLPYALFAVAVILSVMGAAYFTVLAFLAPITLLICEESKMDKLTGAVAINCGALAGGDFPTAALGVIFRGLMDSSYEAAPELEAIDSFVTCKDIKFEKPEAYTTAQKQTLYLMVAMMAVVLVFPLLKLLIPGNAVIKLVAGKIDVGLVAFVFAVIALLMKLAPQKEIIARVPWNTILMIAGAGMLIAVAVEAGTIDLLSNWIGSNVPTFLVPIAFSLVGAVMSFFSSTTGVVCPALFPLIPGLSATTGLGAANLFTCTVLGAQSSAISPFSSGGSLILGSCGNEEERSSLFNRLLFVATPISIGVAAIFNLIVSMVL